MSFGVIVQTSLAAPAAGAATDTGTLFAVGPAGGGTAVDTAVGPLTKLDDWVAAFTDRSDATSAPTYDWLEEYFREGGAPMYFSRYDTDYGAALTSLSPKYGPGQLAVLGQAPSSQLYSDMQSHCVANNRVGVRDVAQASSVSEMAGFGNMAPDNDERGATFGPWVVIPPPTGVSGSGPRTVPASAAICALCSRMDEQGNPNRAPSVEFALQYASDFESVLQPVDMSTLIAAGVNPMSEEYGRLRAMGFWTDIPVSDQTPFWSFAASRARMWMIAQAQSIGSNYYMQTVDGNGSLENRLKTDLDAMAKELYDAGGLFGDVAQNAYVIDVSVAVNTIENLAQGALKAVCQAKFSPVAKSVEVDLVSVPITGALAGAPVASGG